LLPRGGVMTRLDEVFNGVNVMAIEQNDAAPLSL
jgi:hypothetical protein